MQLRGQGVKLSDAEERRQAGGKEFARGRRLSGYWLGEHIFKRKKRGLKSKTGKGG